MPPEQHCILKLRARDDALSDADSNRVQPDCVVHLSACVALDKYAISREKTEMGI